jgi:threonine/homoserine efflux transporter RhtA
MLMQRFSKKIVALVVFLNVVFTGAIMYLFLRTGSEPSTLIGCWFAFTTVELWSLSQITKEKVRTERRGESGQL